MQVIKRFSLIMLLVLSIVLVSIVFGTGKTDQKPFPEVLNEAQSLYMRWTEEQFKSMLDWNEYAGLSDSTKVELENIWIEMLKKPGTSKYYDAINCLATIKSKKAVKSLLEIAADRKEKDNRDRWMAVRALGMIGDISVVPELIPLVYHYNSNTRFWSQISLCRLTGVNFGVDWGKWGEWWNKNKPTGLLAFSETTTIQWGTNPEWTNPQKQLETDKKLIENLKQTKKEPVPVK